MRAWHVPVSVRFMVMLFSLLLGISSCRFMPASQAQGVRTLFLTATPTSVLVFITNPDSPPAMRATGALVAASVRPRERIVILNTHGGTTLVSSQAPDSPSTQVPAPPTPLPPHPTSFQKARYYQAVRQYQSMVLHARTALQRRQQEE